MRSMLVLLLAATIGACGSPNNSRPVVNTSQSASAKGLLAMMAQQRKLERVRHELSVDGHSFALWEKSPPDPRGVVVLLHGRTWSSVPDFDLQVPGEQRSLMDSLAQAGYATFALDQRGYGETSRDASGWLSPKRAADDLAAVLRWVSSKTNKTPALLGWSYGSLVSQLCAQQHPELVSALVLYGYPRSVNSTYSPGPEPSVAPARTPTTAEGAAEDFIVKGATTPSTVAAFVEQALLSDPVRVDWRDRDQFGELDAAKVSVPTLLLHGEHDPYAPAAQQAEVFLRLANADKQWVILPGGDHAAHLEVTGPLFVRAVLGFLGRSGD